MGVGNRKLLILGTGIFAEEVSDIVGEIPGWELAGFVENMDRGRCKDTLDGLPIYWVDELERLREDHWAVCAIGTTKRTLFTGQAESHGMRFATIVHPTARVSPRSSLGAGTIVGPGSVVASHTKIGMHVIINRGVLIGHHTVIGDHITISPGANIAGLCKIEDESYIAMGAVIIDRTRIGSKSVVAAGAVVTKDVPEGVQVMGVPARVVKRDIDGR